MSATPRQRPTPYLLIMGLGAGGVLVLAIVLVAVLAFRQSPKGGPVVADDNTSATPAPAAPAASVAPRATPTPAAAVAAAKPPVPVPAIAPVAGAAVGGVSVGTGNAADDVLAYVTSRKQNVRLNCVVQLSNDTVLVGGTAEGLDWVPAGTPRQELALPPAGGISELAAGGTGGYPFLLQLTPDLRTIQRVVHLPRGAAVDVRFIRSTNMPGQRTGVLYISGEMAGNADAKVSAGYFIARLNGNFVDGAPTGVVWARHIGADGNIRNDQPWDVAADGKVVYAEGTPHGYDWVAIHRVKADGTPDVVEDWRLHICQQDGKRSEWFGTPTSACPRGKVSESCIVLKVWGRGDFRSWTQEDYDMWLPDGNGGKKKGRWPFDMFFAGPFNVEAPDKSPRGRGYIGYGWPSTPCGNVGAIVIDRRDNHIYIGGNNKSSLPHGPDFEPYVVAMTDTGKLKWWMRLYREVPPEAGKSITDDQDARLSTPDQYVDAMAIDYSKPYGAEGALVVVARAHGNNNINFWKGNEIKAPGNPGTSFQPSYTGAGGNFHYQWIGRMTLQDGSMLHATYFAELADGTAVGKDSWADPNLDGWPAFTSGWPALNTTRIRPTIHTDGAGNIYVVAVGRRPITTRNAYQKNYKPGEGQSRWVHFVRVYNQSLTTLKFSSILANPWPATGETGPDDIELRGVYPTKGGVYVVGNSVLDSKPGQSAKPVPTRNVPPWGAGERDGDTGVMGLWHFGQ